VTNLSNLWNLLAYCGGFAVGGTVGQFLEARLIKGFMTVHMIVHDEAHILAQTLRDKGYGVTETIGEGATGNVSMLRSVVNRRDVSKLMIVISETKPETFVTVEEARAVQRGWIRASRNQQS
jgi:uncharacterized protein YebE (UPF0316 family)